MRLFTVIFLTLFLGTQSFAQSSPEHSLTYKLVRSYHVNGTAVLVGLKGENEGDGKVYLSTDGKELLPTNEGKSVGPDVKDVQAVAFVTDEIFLAGTWKNGMYRTTDKGKTWTKLNDFAPADVRCIEVVNDRLIYAGTVSHGLMKSTDKGKTWKICAADANAEAMPIWSLQVHPTNPKQIYAMSFKKGVQLSMNGGKTWETVLYKEDVMMYDMDISVKNPEFMLLAGSSKTEGYIYGSMDGGLTWDQFTAAPNVLYNTVAFAGEDQASILAGSWDKGFYHGTSEEGWTKLREITFETASGIHADQKTVFFFTWGNGVYKMKNNWANRK